MTRLVCVFWVKDSFWCRSVRQWRYTFTFRNQLSYCVHLSFLETFPRTKCNQTALRNMSGPAENTVMLTFCVARPYPHRTQAWKFAPKSFDVAWVHLYSQQYVLFAQACVCVSCKDWDLIYFLCWRLWIAGDIDAGSGDDQHAAVRTAGHDALPPHDGDAVPLRARRGTHDGRQGHQGEAQHFRHEFIALEPTIHARVCHKLHCIPGHGFAFATVSFPIFFFVRNMEQKLMQRWFWTYLCKSAKTKSTQVHQVEASWRLKCQHVIVAWLRHGCGITKTEKMAPPQKTLKFWVPTSLVDHKRTKEISSLVVVSPL